MRKNMKKIISILVVATLLFSVMPMAFAGTAFADFPTGWSAEAMTAAVNNGLLTGYEDGTIRPEANLTRAEVATIITRAFGATTTSDISAFRDVPANAWFTPYIARAVKMGALNGTSATTMDPDLPITREQVFTAVARVLVLSDSDTSVLNKFKDAGEISDWATNAMAALVKRGYVNGDLLGNVNPKSSITREEFAQFMHNAIRTYITKEGTYSKDLEGITVIRVPNVTLQNLSATSDIVVGDGVGTGAVLMNGVTIEKRLLARGGTITLLKTTTGRGVVVNNVNGNTHFNNYRAEAVFAGIIQNTSATFLSVVINGGSSGGREYTLNFYLHADDETPYKTIRNISYNKKLGADLPTPAAEDIIGYKFLGWHRKNMPGSAVTASTPITGNWDVVANLERIEYPVTFVDEDGVSPFVDFIDGFTPVATANVETPYTLPTEAQIKRNGYTFRGWTDALGNPVTAIIITVSTPADGFVLKPVFTKDTYYVEFYNADYTPASFVDGYTPPVKYAVDNLPALPNDTQVVVPDGERFMYWVNENGEPVYGLTVTDDMTDGQILKLYTFNSIVTPDTYTVSFYDSYGALSVWMKNVTVTENQTVAKADIPETGYRKVSGYEENGSIASVYEGNEYTHFTVPTYWYLLNTYVCADCGHQQQRTHLPEACANCSADASRLSVSGKAEMTPFDENVVIVGDLEVYLLYQRFGLFLNYPDTDLTMAILAAYDKDTRLMDTYKDLLTSLGGQLNLALSLNQIPKYDTATETLKEKLVSAGLIDEDNNIQILDLPIGIATLVKEDTANKMVNQYIRDVVNDPAKLDSLLQMVDLATLVQQMDVSALIDSMDDQKIAEIITAPANQEAVIDAVVTDLGKTDSSMRTMIIDSLVNDLKAGTPNASVLNFIRSSDKLVDMIITALADKDPTMTEVMSNYFKNNLADNTDLLDTLTSTVQTDLQADTEAGANLRQAILTSDQLLNLLEDPSMKEQVVALLLEPTFIDKVLADATFRTDLLEAAVEDEKFVNYLVDTDEFAKFILPKIRKGGTLYVDVIALLDGEGAFVTEMLADVKNSDTFLDLIDEGGALRSDILGKINLGDEALEADILNQLVNKEPIGDSAIEEEINKVLIGYLKDYIIDEASLDPRAENAIETVILSYIRDLLSRDDDDITDSELADFKDDIITLKTTFVADAGNLSTISTIIKNFINTDPDETRVVVGSAYDNLAEDLVTLIKTNSSVYADVEDKLKNTLVSASVLSDYILKNSTSPTVIDLLADYFASAAGDGNKRTEIQGYISQCLPTVADDDLKTHIATFMTDSDNETMVRTELLNYINTNLGTQQLRTNIAEFLVEVDAAFVQANRGSIVAALDGVDLSSFVDAQMVKTYINDLPTVDDKNAFADDVFNGLKNSVDYSSFMYSLMNEPTFAINASNVGLLQAVSGAIRDLDYDFVMSLTDNATLTKIIDVMGDAFLRDYFETMKNDYCDGFDTAITRVKNGGAAENYTTSLQLRVNMMELLVKLYEKAKPELIQRLEAANVRYDSNEYLQWLVEDNDVVSALFDGNGTLATETSTGYAIKGIMDYYNYILTLVTVADDAICWYGDSANVTEAELDAVLDAAFGKIYSAHSKLNEILETYESENKLPAPIESLVGKVKQINSLLTRFDGQIKDTIRKYLNSSVNDKLEDGDIHENEKVQRVIDLLIGIEEPTFTIDSLYTVFYRFDDNVQAALQKVIDSGALRKAIDRFESTDFGSVFKGNGRFASAADILEEIRNNGKVESAVDSLYDLMVALAEEGIEPFRTEKDDVSVTDAYTFKVAGFELIVKRFYK